MCIDCFLCPSTSWNISSCIVSAKKKINIILLLKTQWQQATRRTRMSWLPLFALRRHGYILQHENAYYTTWLTGRRGLSRFALFDRFTLRRHTTAFATKQVKNALNYAKRKKYDTNAYMCFLFELGQRNKPKKSDQTQRHKHIVMLEHEASRNKRKRHQPLLLWGHHDVTIKQIYMRSWALMLWIFWTWWTAATPARINMLFKEENSAANWWLVSHKNRRKTLESRLLSKARNWHWY